MRTRPSAAVFAALTLVASLGATLGMTSSADAARTDHRPAAQEAAAQRALAGAQAALHQKGEPARDVTLALRDLFLQRDALTGADRAAADAILKRPTDDDDPDYYGDGADVQSACGTHVCLHWVEEGDDAADPAYAAQTLTTMNSVHETYVDAGYRSPLPDDGREGNDLPDVYLSNIGPDGYYGYCTTDGQAPTEGRAYHAYCVLDNDYDPVEFGSANTPIENMQVTAAHEYFHAVQYAYDAGEDSWLIEATATWAEDEVFDDVNDNLYYLESGQLGDPATPLDQFGFNSYGNWIFFRFLTEQYTEEEGTMPAFMLELWELLDSTDGAPDYYSLQGLKKVLADRGSTLRGQYGDFAAANQNPAYNYEEGAGSQTEDAYPYPPFRLKLHPLSPAKPSSTSSIKLDHLTSATGAYTPSNKMTSSKWKLRIRVDLANRSRGSEARVVVYFANGPVMQTITLDKYGEGSRTVPFDYDDVMAVEVTLANASDRMRNCWQGDETYSCYGTPVDDRLASQVKVTARK